MTLWRWIRYCVLRLTIVIAVFGLSAVLVLSYAPHLARSFLAWGGAKTEKGSALLAPPLIAENAPSECGWLDQGWSDEDRAWFHNASQGTATFPVSYAWFKALERPEISPFSLLVSRGLISDPEYLARLGFLAPRACDPQLPDSYAEKPVGYGVLPVGFAVLKGGTDPTTGKEFADGLGLTCAACHTGSIRYKGKELRVDGSQAMIHLGNLERIIGLSICYTSKMPWRERRFVNAVDPEGNEAEIGKHLKETCAFEVEQKVYAERAILKRKHAAHTEEGFGRLDALNRIGNQVFHENLADPQERDEPAIKEQDGGLSQDAFDVNFAAHTAPVSFPPIWDVPNFSWAQYDASILNPGIRNIGEAMGVAAKMNMTAPSRTLFSSTVDVLAIARIEGMLQGARSKQAIPVKFDGPPPPLQAPRWQDAAEKLKKMKSWDPADTSWDLSEEQVTAGRGLYRELCFECHRGPPRDAQFPSEDSFWKERNSDQIDASPEDANWMLIGDEWLFNVVQKKVSEIGTDPEQARVLAERRVNLPNYLGIDTQKDVLDDCGVVGDDALRKSYAVSLMAAVRRTEDQWFADFKDASGNPLPASEIDEAKGKRGNCPNPRVFRRMNDADAKAGEVDFSYLAVPHYRARPLDGIWATAPYIHNGSVPTLDDLLRPQDQRPDVFCVGPMDFDPGKVGLKMNEKTAGAEADEVVCDDGLSLFDTRERGNSNRGHSFEGAGTSFPQGVIGRELNDTERGALISYLKTL